MPFANLPVSGFQAPNAPDWTRFAAQANEFIAHRPVPNTADDVQKAVDQINEILKMSSPEAKAQRALQLETTRAQLQMFQQYRSNPEEFEWKNGHLQYKDKYKNIMEATRFANSLKQGKLLDARLNALGGDAGDNYRRKLAEGFRGAGSDTSTIESPNATGDSSTGAPSTEYVPPEETQDYGAPSTDDTGEGN